MKKLFFPIAAVVSIFVAIPSQAAGKPNSAKADQTQPVKVWTNQDLDQLRSRGLLSIVGQESSAATAQSAPTATEPTHPVYESRLDDPAWYADQAAGLRAELDQREAALNEQLTTMVLAVDRITQPGIALDEPSVGVTPEAAVHVLQERIQDVQNQLDGLSDLAHRHGIEPGVLRG